MIFFGCSSLTRITVPPSVTKIGKTVFSECSTLIQITISSSVTEISNSFFYESNWILFFYRSSLLKQVFDIDILILTEKYEESIKLLNGLISKTNENTFLYTHKDYSGCISDFEKALELTKDEDLINFLKFLLKNMSIYSLTP